MKAFRFFLPISLLVALLAYQEYRHQQFVQEIDASLTTSRVQLEDIIQEKEDDFRAMMQDLSKEKYLPYLTFYDSILQEIKELQNHIQLLRSGFDQPENPSLTADNLSALNFQFIQLKDTISESFSELVMQHGTDLGLSINDSWDYVKSILLMKKDGLSFPEFYHEPTKGSTITYGELALTLAEQQLLNIQLEVLSLVYDLAGGWPLQCFPYLIPVVQPFASYYAPGDTFRAMISIDHYFAHGYNPEKIRYFVNGKLVSIGKSSGTAAYYEFYPMPKGNIDLKIRVEYYDEVDQKWQEPFLGAYTYTLRSQLPMTNHYQSVSPPKETITPYGMD